MTLFQQKIYSHWIPTHNIDTHTQKEWKHYFTVIAAFKSESIYNWLLNRDLHRIHLFQNWICIVIELGAHFCNPSWNVCTPLIGEERDRENSFSKRSILWCFSMIANCLFMHYTWQIGYYYQFLTIKPTMEGWTLCSALLFKCNFLLTLISNWIHGLLMVLFHYDKSEPYCRAFLFLFRFVMEVINNGWVQFQFYNLPKLFFLLNLPYKMSFSEHNENIFSIPQRGTQLNFIFRNPLFSYNWLTQRGYSCVV